MVKLMTYEWWHANKAKSLPQEPLAKALKNIGDDLKKYEKNPKRIEFVIPLLEELPTVVAAITKTEKKCSSLLHKKTKANLGKMKAEANKLRTDLQKKRSDFSRITGRIKTGRMAALKLVTTLQRHLGTDAIGTPQKLVEIDALKTLLEALNGTVGHARVRQKEMTLAVNKYVSGLLGNLKDLKGRLAKGARADQLDALRSDLKKNITRLIKVPIE